MRNARFSITISQSSSFPRSFPAQGQTAIPVLSWSGYPDISPQGKPSPDFRFGCRPDLPVLVLCQEKVQIKYNQFSLFM